jgi:hypothetical protein
VRVHTMPVLHGAGVLNSSSGIMCVRDEYIDTMFNNFLQVRKHAFAPIALPYSNHPDPSYPRQPAPFPNRTGKPTPEFAVMTKSMESLAKAQAKLDAKILTAATKAEQDAAKQAANAEKKSTKDAAKAAKQSIKDADKAAKKAAREALKAAASSSDVSDKPVSNKDAKAAKKAERKALKQAARQAAQETAKQITEPQLHESETPVEESEISATADKAKEQQVHAKGERHKHQKRCGCKKDKHS